MELCESCGSITATIKVRHIDTMKRKPQISRARFTVTMETGLSDYYNHFKRAKDDDTLDIMYEGLVKQLKKPEWDDVDEKVKTRIENTIYIAYGHRQEDFDGIGKDSQNVTSQRVEAIEKSSPKSSAEDKLGAALRSLYQS